MNIFTLLILFQLKHFLADYPLQGRYMLGKFKDRGWVAPLLAHVSVHGAFTLIIASYVRPDLALALALFDMSVHFVMDRIKADSRLMGRWKALSPLEYKSATWMSEGTSMIDGRALPKRLDLKDYVALGQKDLRSNTLFWWALGLDQMVHHLTDLLLVFFLTKEMGCL